MSVAGYQPYGYQSVSKYTGNPLVYQQQHSSNYNNYNHTSRAQANSLRTSSYQGYPTTAFNNYSTAPSNSYYTQRPTVSSSYYSQESSPAASYVQKATPSVYYPGGDLYKGIHEGAYTGSDQSSTTYSSSGTPTALTPAANKPNNGPACVPGPITQRCMCPGRMFRKMYKNMGGHWSECSDEERKCLVFRRRFH